MLNLNGFVYLGRPLHFSFFEFTFQQNIWWLSQKPSSCWIHLSLSRVLLESFFLSLTSQPLSCVFLPCPSTWPCKGTWAHFSPRAFHWCMCSVYISFVCFKWSPNDVIPQTWCSPHEKCVLWFVFQLSVQRSLKKKLINFFYRRVYRRIRIASAVHSLKSKCSLKQNLRFLNSYSLLCGARLSLCEHLLENVLKVYELCDLLNKDSFL